MWGAERFSEWSGGGGRGGTPVEQSDHSPHSAPKISMAHTATVNGKHVGRGRKCPPLEFTHTCSHKRTCPHSERRVAACVCGGGTMEAAGSKKTMSRERQRATKRRPSLTRHGRRVHERARLLFRCGRRRACCAHDVITQYTHGGISRCICGRAEGDDYRRFLTFFLFESAKFAFLFLRPHIKKWDAQSHFAYSALLRIAFPPLPLPFAPDFRPCPHQPVAVANPPCRVPPYQCFK